MDKKTWKLTKLNKDADIKDRWLGLRTMRNTFQPRLYEKYDKDGRRLTKKEQAKGTAEYLAQKQLGDKQGNGKQNTKTGPQNKHFCSKIQQRTTKYGRAT